MISWKYLLNGASKSSTEALAQPGGQRDKWFSVPRGNIEGHDNYFYQMGLCNKHVYKQPSAFQTSIHTWDSLALFLVLILPSKTKQNN